MYWEVEVQLHTFLTLALDRGEWSASWPCCFSDQITACGKHHIGGWVGSTAGLGGMELLGICILIPQLSRTQPSYYSNSANPAPKVGYNDASWYDSCWSIAQLATCYLIVKFLAWQILKPWSWNQYVASKQWALSDLHGIATEKTVLCIVTTVKTSNPVQLNIWSKRMKINYHSWDQM
jgi:hypothetical protein